jgi:hypothetical protein
MEYCLERFGSGKRRVIAWERAFAASLSKSSGGKMFETEVLSDASAGHFGRFESRFHCSR